MRIIRNSPLGEGNSRKKEIGLMKIYAGSNGRTRHPRGKGTPLACFIFRGWISRSPFPSFLDGFFLKIYGKNVATIDVPTLFQ